MPERRGWESSGPPALTPGPALPWGFSEARVGKDGAMVLGEPPTPAWLTLALRQRKRSWTLGTCW